MPPSLDNTEKTPLVLFKCGFIYWKRVWISPKVRLLDSLATCNTFPGLWTEHQHPPACWSAPWALETIQYHPTCGALLTLSSKDLGVGRNNSFEAVSVLLCSLADRMEGPSSAAQISGSCQKENTRPV